MMRDEHPDEGTIHGWLDGALDATSAARVAAHVESCPSCAERVAEARGLIAGASRVVGLLDDAPETIGDARWGTAGAAEAERGAAAARADARSAWRRFRLTPARAAIAATVLVAVGVTLTYDRTVPDGVAKARPRAAAGSLATSPATVPQIAPAIGGRPRDPLLDSAVQHNIAAAQPPRTVEAARTPALPSPPVAGSVATVDSVAPLRVAAGRVAAQARRDSTAGVADRATAEPVMATAPAPTVASAAPAARLPDSGRGIAGGSAKTADAAADASMRRATARRVITATSIPIPMECYRVEPAAGGSSSALWGSVETPFIVALDASGGGAHVFTTDGVDTGTGATWARGGADSVVVRLRRRGFQGTLELGAPGTARAGVMRSAPLPSTSAPAVPIVATRTVCPTR